MSLPLEITIKLPDGSEYQQPTGLFINNEFVPSKTGTTIDSIDPSTGKISGTVYSADRDDVDVAVAAARTAFKTVWKKTPGSDRGKLLNRLADIMEQKQDILSAVESYDSGKPKAQNAIYDIEECYNCFRYYAGWADKVQGRVIPTTPEKFAYTVHEPYGVCGQIIPWNYPLAMAAWKIAPAVAAGNTVVLKSAEQTPLSLLFFANLVVEAGFPPGVINIISGLGPVAGAALAAHTGVDKIAFTGSTATGKVIQRLASENLKAVTLECGGKSPLLIFKDCDLDQAVKWAAVGIMSNQGQICTSTSRIYIEEGVYDEFLTAFAKHVKEDYKQGSPFDDEVVVGPQVSKAQYDKILGYLDVGKKEGARVVLGGEANKEAGTGYYIKPTIFADVKPSMRIVKEEIFGPVVSCGVFKTMEEAIELANSSEYGLGAAVFTQDITKAHNVANALEAGMVWINSSNDSDIRVPFGGVKMSGVGRELGEYGLTTYTQAKAIHVNLGTKL